MYLSLLTSKENLYTNELFASTIGIDVKVAQTALSNLKTNYPNVRRAIRQVVPLPGEPDKHKKGFYIEEENKYILRGRLAEIASKANQTMQANISFPVVPTDVQIARKSEVSRPFKAETPSSGIFTLTSDEGSLLVRLALSNKLSYVYDQANRPLSAEDESKIRKLKAEIKWAFISQDILKSLRRKAQAGLLDNRDLFIKQNEKSEIADLLKIIYEIDSLNLGQFIFSLIPSEIRFLPMKELW